MLSKFAVAALALAVAPKPPPRTAQHEVRYGSEAIRIVLATCGRDWRFVKEKDWAVRKEGALWHVWTPNIPGRDPNDAAMFGGYVRATDGGIDHCYGRTE